MLLQAAWAGMARPLALTPGRGFGIRLLTGQGPLRTQSRVGDQRGDFSREIRCYKGPWFSHSALTLELGSRIVGGTFDMGQKSCKIGALLTYSQTELGIRENYQRSGVTNPATPTTRTEFWDGGPGSGVTEDLDCLELFPSPGSGGSLRLEVKGQGTRGARRP